MFGIGTVLWPLYSLIGFAITMYNIGLLMYFAIYNWAQDALESKPGMLLAKVYEWTLILRLKVTFAKKYEVDFSPLVMMFIIGIGGQIILRTIFWYW